VPVAVNGCVAPIDTDAEPGDTAIETKAAAETVRLVEPAIEPEVALMIVVPILPLVAFPVAPMMATLVVAEAHVAVLVKSWVLPSEKVPVAVNCWLVPSAMEGLLGVTVIELRTAAVTVKLSVPVTEPYWAEMVTVPCPRALPKPVLLTVAVVGLEELQVAELVKSCVVPSVNVPVAVNC
jgi:hypothetical protein